MLCKTIYGFTAKVVPKLDMQVFQKKHKKEYEALMEGNGCFCNGK